MHPPRRQPTISVQSAGFGRSTNRKIQDTYHADPIPGKMDPSSTSEGGVPIQTSRGAAPTPIFLSTLQVDPNAIPTIYVIPLQMPPQMTLIFAHILLVLKFSGTHNPPPNTLLFGGGEPQVVGDITI